MFFNKNSSQIILKTHMKPYSLSWDHTHAIIIVIAKHTHKQCVSFENHTHQWTEAFRCNCCVMSMVSDNTTNHTHHLCGFSWIIFKYAKPYSSHPEAYSPIWNYIHKPESILIASRSILTTFKSILTAMYANFFIQIRGWVYPKSYSPTCLMRWPMLREFLRGIGMLTLQTNAIVQWAYHWRKSIIDYASQNVEQTPGA